MAEIKGDELHRSRADEDVEGHKRDEALGNVKAREGYEDPSGGEGFGRKGRISEDDDVEGHKRDESTGYKHSARLDAGDSDDVEGHRLNMRESYEAPTGPEGVGHGARITEDDDVEGHSFTTLRSPSSKGE